jgi:hypothetical protein
LAVPVSGGLLSAANLRNRANSEASVLVGSRIQAKRPAQVRFLFWRESSADGSRTLAQASFVYAAELRSGFGHLPLNRVRRTDAPYDRTMKARSEVRFPSSAADVEVAPRRQEGRCCRRPLQIAVMAKQYRDEAQILFVPAVVQRALIAPLAATVRDWATPRSILATPPSPGPPA